MRQSFILGSFTCHVRNNMKILVSGLVCFVKNKIFATILLNATNLFVPSFLLFLLILERLLGAALFFMSPLLDSIFIQAFNLFPGNKIYWFLFVQKWYSPILYLDRYKSCLYWPLFSRIHSWNYFHTPYITTWSSNHCFCFL